IRDDVDRREYLYRFGRSIIRSDWNCISYAVMSNHVHLGLIAGVDSLSSWLRPAHGAFAELVNIRDQRIGSVFVRGPRMIEMKPDGAASLVSYIHPNPVRAGVVTTADETTWTSHRAYLGREPAPEWLNVSVGLDLMHFPDGGTMGHWIDATPIERAQV